MVATAPCKKLCCDSLEDLTMIEKTDPVCGMAVDTQNPPAKVEYKGTMYYFCSPVCLAAFRKNPDRYVKTTQHE